MSDTTITVIGAGLIGVSLGLALKQSENAPTLIIHDKEPAHSREAIKRGAFDKSHWNLLNACENADLIVLAIPTAGIKPTLEALAADLKEGVIITDTAPTKADVIKTAASVLPPHAHFVGGNPVVSATNSGPKNAHANLFKNALYCLTPTANTPPKAINMLEAVIQLIGATPFFLDPLEHDGLMSGVESLPALLSLALVQSVTRPPSWREMRKLAGGTFSLVSSGAGGDPDSLAATFIHNKENILRQARQTINTLNALTELIETADHEALTEAIDQVIVARDAWQSDFEAQNLSNLAPRSSVKLERPGLFNQLFGFGRSRKK